MEPNLHFNISTKRKTIIDNVRKLFDCCDAILVVAGAGMSADSGVTTYRGDDGLWSKKIKVGNNEYKYEEISSLKMWKEYPELAWGFKAKFFDDAAQRTPHDGYRYLLNYFKKYNKDYFICTSNIDNYFESAGYSKDKIYEVHGSMKNLQCMSIKCSKKNGVVKTTPGLIPNYNSKTLIASNLPKCSHCSNILRPNVSMFGDFDFYGKPYEYIRKKMETWMNNVEKNDKKLVILEIGCGVNQHSIRMNDGVMMSGEWKLPKIKKLIKTIRINPNDCFPANNTINLNMGAKEALRGLFSK
jgi:NAD-dependent SIR2 family protein deacetylase